MKTKEDVRKLAISWQNYQSDKDLSYYEMSLWGEVFQILGERFDLLEEFKDNGII